MAKQKGIIILEGTIGKLSFYTTKNENVIRSKCGPDKERQENAIRMKRSIIHILNFVYLPARTVFAQTVLIVICGWKLD